MQKIDNNYGVTHGLAVAGLIAITFLILKNAAMHQVSKLIIIAIVGMFAPYGVVYWLRREAKARGDYKFWTWYLDSMFDFLTPLIVYVSLITGVYLWGGSG